MAFGAGPPNGWDLHEDGKYYLTFWPVAHLRPIEQGEEFVPVPVLL